MRARIAAITLSNLIALILLTSSVPAQQSFEVTKADATEHLIKKVEPEYPAIAKAARVQGKVTLKATISESGAATDAKLVDGAPMLVSTAINAVKQWQYKPFIVDGKTTAVATVIEVPFSLGISEADYKKEQEAANNYFKQEDKCRGLLKEKQYSDAESSCRTAAELVQKLPPERANERRLAYELLGHALLSEKKFSDALVPYQKELAIAQASLRPYEAELGYAYHDVALTLFATGDLRQFER